MLVSPWSSPDSTWRPAKGMSVGGCNLMRIMLLLLQQGEVSLADSTEVREEYKHRTSHDAETADLFGRTECSSCLGSHIAAWSGHSGTVGTPTSLRRAATVSIILRALFMRNKVVTITIETVRLFRLNHGVNPATSRNLRVLVTTLLTFPMGPKQSKRTPP